jgi:hypothetical protein
VTTFISSAMKTFGLLSSPKLRLPREGWMIIHLILRRSSVVIISTIYIILQFLSCCFIIMSKKLYLALMTHLTNRNHDICTEKNVTSLMRIVLIQKKPAQENFQGLSHLICGRRLIQFAAFLLESSTDKPKWAITLIHKPDVSSFM